MTAQHARPLGRSGLSVNPVGLGCMGLSWAYGTALSQADAVDLIRAALDEGVDHLDTAEIYGQGDSERKVGEAVKGRRDEVVIATKFGPVPDPETGYPSGIDGSPENVRRASEGSLKRLGVEAIDLYYLHRTDPGVPIEETVGEMGRLVEEGKVRALGLSECAPDTLRRAHEAHPIAAVQSEYSIFTRGVEDEMLPLLRDLGVSLVAYSPLGRGMLTGRFDVASKPEGRDDFRASNQPRFEDGNFEANLALVEEVRAVASAHEAHPAQVALAWALSQQGVLTIPGTTKIDNVRTNLGALGIELTADERDRLGALADQVKGDRYDARGMASVNR